MSNAHPGRIIPQDVVPEDGADSMSTALPVSQSEIEELLYGDDRPAAERVERLKELAAALRDQQQGDFGDDDAGALYAEVEQAIAQLNGDLPADADLADSSTAMDDDPLDHRETLSPDSDELEEIEEEDEASLSEDTEPLDDSVLDPEEWQDGDGFDPTRGVK
jgi:hypothetical protein